MIYDISDIYISELYKPLVYILDIYANIVYIIPLPYTKYTAFTIIKGAGKIVCDATHLDNFAL